jgi:hypothetical protein
MLHARRETAGAMDLEAILTLAGRLEDQPGFDAPRQRFRRYLREHVTQVAALGGLIEACQNAPGDQHHRALQDLVVSLGRFLGFDVTYGAYEPTPEAAIDHGGWRSRSRLQVVIHVATDAPHSGVEALERSHSLLSATPGGAARTCGLCVITPASGGPATLQGVRQEPHLDFPILLAGTGTLVSLADVVANGRLTHDDVVRVFEHEMPIEFVIDLLDRSGPAPSPPPERAPSVVVPQPAPAEGPSYWLATLAGDLDAEPEVFLRLVVAGRHIFGVPADGPDGPAARPGDAICFHIPGKGVVGQARVRALADGHAAIRSAHRFRQLLQLEALSLHAEAPVPLDPDTQLRLRTVQWRGSRPTSSILKMSPESYWTLTRS